MPKMTASDLASRENIVKSMKKNIGSFRKRYGKRAKDVMYATATKMAMKDMKKEEVELGEAQMPADMKKKMTVKAASASPNGPVSWQGKYTKGVKFAEKGKDLPDDDRVTSFRKEEVEQIDEISRFKSREIAHELRHEDEYQRRTGRNYPGRDAAAREAKARKATAGKASEPHAVHIDGKKWKTFSSHSHATNVGKKITSKNPNAKVTIHKEEVEHIDEKQLSPVASLKREFIKANHGSKPGHTDSVKKKVWFKRVHALKLTPDDQIPSRRQLAKIEKNKALKKEEVEHIDEAAKKKPMFKFKGKASARIAAVKALSSKNASPQAYKGWGLSTQKEAVDYVELDMNNLGRDAAARMGEDDGPHTTKLSDVDTPNFTTVVDPATVVNQPNSKGNVDQNVKTAPRMSGKPFKTIRKKMRYGGEELTLGEEVELEEAMRKPRKLRSAKLKSIIKNLDAAVAKNKAGQDKLNASMKKEEVEHLDELSTKTMTSHYWKASVDRTKAWREGDIKRFKKREKGIKTNIQLGSKKLKPSRVSSRIRSGGIGFKKGSAGGGTGHYTGD